MKKAIDVVGLAGAGGKQSSHIGLHLDAIYDSKKLIAVVTGSALLIAAAYLFLAAPVYRADILIQFQKTDSTSVPKNILSDVSSMFDSKPDSPGEMEVLGSRLVVAQAVDKLNLAVVATPRYFPLIGRQIATWSDTVSTPGPRGYVWGAERIDVGEFETPSQFYGRKFKLKKLDARRYEASFRDFRFQGVIGQTTEASTPLGPIVLRVDAMDANPGATFDLTRNSPVAAVEALRKKLSISDKGKESNIIKASLDDADPIRAAAILNAVASAYVEQEIERKSGEAARSIKFLETQLPDLKQRVEASEALFNQFRASHGTVNLGDEAASLLKRTVEVQKTRVDLEQKRNDLLALYKSDHPAVRAVDAQLRVAQKELDSLASQSRTLPPMEQDMLRLQRDVQVNSTLYTSLLNTFEQLRVVKAGKLGNARLVDSAVVPDQPFWPKPTLVMVVASLFGLLSGIAIALTRKQLFDAVNEPSEIEENIGLPVYATVPYSPHEARLTKAIRTPQSKGGLLATSSVIDPAIESIRGFRTAVDHALTNARNRVVLITGPTPGIGKSFITVNLAAILGAAGKRVLLVDADLHRGDLHRHFAIKPGLGLSDLLYGSCTPQNVIHLDVCPGVDFVSSGTQFPSPSDLFARPKAHSVIERLGAGYDVVLLDAAPILPTDAALQLASLAATTFLVAQQGVTGVGELRESMRRLERIGLSVHGVVVNGMKLRSGRRSYGYGRYRYSAESYELKITRKA
ncbi:tyrosine-protein kinase involved in EPS biosynthesis [Caballeronia novacaledonica]|uniref:Tyrosine-protein kinase involved in EPS biosynthesis n=1 Tax=Caballeronia novacaledonica TaxID=1544861 RepID=A0A2U3I5I5_9BURK|nr:GNVR domain-containing protein [Caballeronia novacaledonica]SPB15371.1 tyrosine-protein kinase involved in EPS biosynthesis [Caballeronia novacaledonica]